MFDLHTGQAPCSVPALSRPVRTPSMAGSAGFRGAGDGFLTSSKQGSKTSQRIEIWLPAGVSEDDDDDRCSQNHLHLCASRSHHGQKYNYRGRCKGKLVGVPIFSHHCGSGSIVPNFHLCDELALTSIAHGAPQFSGFSFADSDWWGRGSLSPRVRSCQSETRFSASAVSRCWSDIDLCLG